MIILNHIKETNEPKIFNQQSYRKLISSFSFRNNTLFNTTMKNLMKRNLAMAVLGGFWVILSSTTFADAILNDISGRVTSVNGSGSGPPAGTTFRSSTTPSNWIYTYPNTASVTWGDGTKHFIRDTRQPYTLWYVTQTQTLSAVWENPSSLNTNQARIRISSQSFAIFPQVKPPTTYTLDTFININGTQTTLSSTTPDANSEVILTQPNLPNITFKYWTRNGTSQTQQLPFSFNITEDTTIVYHFEENPTYTHNLTLPSDSITSRAVTVTGSVQGALVVGRLIAPGETFMASYFAIPGETITITADGVTVDQHTFELENPIDYTASVTLQAVLPEPTPEPTPFPGTIFNTNSAIPPSTGNPPPPNPNYNTNGNDTIFNGVTNPINPLPSPPPPNTGDNIPNPFGTFNPTNFNPMESAADFYGVIKQAIQDGLSEDGLTEQQLEDTQGIDAESLLRSRAVDNAFNTTASNLYQLADETEELMSKAGQLFTALTGNLPDPDTNPSVQITIPTIGSFTLSLNALPGRDLLRAIFTFFIWLQTFVMSIHIIRSGIS